MGDKFKRQVDLVEKKEAKDPRWRKWLIIASISFSIVFLLSLAVNGLNKFYDTHRLMIKSPVIFQMPIRVEKREYKIISPLQDKKKTSLVPVAEAEVKDNSDILRKIYQLESSGGKNDSCRDQGLFNGYGYGQSQHAWNCFATLSEVTAKVDDWFNQRFAEGYSLSEAICYYNTGYRQSDCSYYQRYLSI